MFSSFLVFLLLPFVPAHRNRPIIGKCTILSDVRKDEIGKDRQFFINRNHENFFGQIFGKFSMDFQIILGKIRNLPGNSEETLFDKIAEKIFS